MKKSILNKVFKGRLVTLTTDMMTMVSQQTEEGEVSQTLPVSFDAYLVDVDKDYYYLSTDHPDYITDIVQKSVVRHIRIVPDVVDTLLNEMEPSGGMN